MCEGENTEPGYLDSLRIEEKIQLVEIEIVGAAGAPKTLVEYAVEKKRKAEREAKRDWSQRYDEVWCVFDRDEHLNVPEALQQARDNGVNVAFSNPCFELWILLHFQDQFAWIHRHDAQTRCGAHVPGYDKKVTYRELRSGYREAVRRAKQLESQQQRDDQPTENPVTWVHRLTERLLELSRESLLREIRRR